MKKLAESVTPLGRGKEPLPQWIKARWYDPNWLEIEKWLEFANHQPTEDDPLVNFGIRNFRSVSPEDLAPLYQYVREVLEWVIQRPRPGGIDRYEPDPSRLFTYALELSELSRIRRCENCPRFFKAKRKDQKACSKRCSNALRQQRLRDRRKQYEQNRKSNRKNKKAREQGKRQATYRELKTGRRS